MMRYYVTLRFIIPPLHFTMFGIFNYILTTFHNILLHLTIFSACLTSFHNNAICFITLALFYYISHILHICNYFELYLTIFIFSYAMFRICFIIFSYFNFVLLRLTIHLIYLCLTEFIVLYAMCSFIRVNKISSFMKFNKKSFIIDVIYAVKLLLV